MVRIPVDSLSRHIIAFPPYSASHAKFGANRRHTSSAAQGLVIAGGLW